MSNSDIKPVDITVKLHKDLHGNEEICPTCNGNSTGSYTNVVLIGVILYTVALVICVSLVGKNRGKQNEFY